MKRICLNLKYQFTFNVQSIDEDVTFKSGLSWLTTSPEKAEITTSTKEKDAGNYVETVISVTCEESELSITPLIGAPMILQVSYEDESTEVIGSLQHPSKITNPSTENGYHKFNIVQRKPI